MIVQVDNAGAASITDVDSFTSFHVAAASGVDVDDALRRNEAGYLTDQDARVRVDWLRAQAEERSLPASWYENLDGMLNYAATKNWLNDDDTITAHVELAT